MTKTTTADTNHELRATLRGLLCGDGFWIETERDPFVPGRVDVGVFTRNSGDSYGNGADMLGAGSCESEALADAIANVRGWESNR